MILNRLPTLDRSHSSASCRRWVSLTLVAGLMMMTLPGCGGGNPGGGVPVRGTVRWNEEPLEQGSIAFHDQAGTTVALGLIKNGRYSVRQSPSHDGVPPGSYLVSVLSWIERPGTENAQGKVSQGISRIPKKYLSPETSQLSAEVPEKGASLDFELTGEPPAK